MMAGKIAHMNSGFQQPFGHPAIEEKYNGFALNSQGWPRTQSTHRRVK